MHAKNAEHTLCIVPQFSQFVNLFFCNSSFFGQCCPRETLHKARLTALHAICLQIFRHIAQKSLAIRQYACGISMQSAEKSDYASYAQALCSVSPGKTKKRTSRLVLFQNRIISGIGYSTTPFCSSSARAVSTESTPTAFFTGANSLLRSTSNARQLSCMCTMSSTSVSNL